MEHKYHNSMCYLCENLKYFKNGYVSIKNHLKAIIPHYYICLEVYDIVINSLNVSLNYIFENILF